MILPGIKLNSQFEVIVPIIHGEDTVFFAVKPAQSLDEYFDIAPAPKAPVAQRPGEAPRENETPDFIKRKNEHLNNMYTWLVLKTVTHVYQDQTEEVEVTDADGNTRTKAEHFRVKAPVIWEKANANDPTTYKFVAEELVTQGLLDSEIRSLYDGVARANNLSDDLVKEARENFYRGKPLLVVREMT